MEEEGILGPNKADPVKRDDLVLLLLLLFNAKFGSDDVVNEAPPRAVLPCVNIVVKRRNGVCYMIMMIYNGCGVVK